MIKDIKRMKNERGFTLIELLVVIVILGILAAVVVFAVGGLTDKGNTSACKIDTRTIRTAEEAYSAQQNPAQYTTMQGLVDAKLLSEASTEHDVQAVTSGPDGIYGNADDTPAGVDPTDNFEVVITGTNAAKNGGVDKGCGDTAGDIVGHDANAI